MTTPDPRATLELCERLDNEVGVHAGMLAPITYGNLRDIIRDLRRLREVEKALLAIWDELQPNAPPMILARLEMEHPVLPVTVALAHREGQ